MAYGVILKHLVVDKITSGGNFNGRWQERVAGRPFLNWCGEHWGAIEVQDWER
jgi:hypothetical protein